MNPSDLIEKIQKLPANRPMQMLRAASVLAIIGLLMMMWPLFDPTPAPVLISLSVGQAIGTVSFLAYLGVVAWDLRRKRHSSSVLGDASGASLPPAPPSSRGDLDKK